MEPKLILTQGRMTGDLKKYYLSRRNFLFNKDLENYGGIENIKGRNKAFSGGISGDCIHERFGKVKEGGWDFMLLLEVLAYAMKCPFRKKRLY